MKSTNKYIKRIYALFTTMTMAIMYAMSVSAATADGWGGIIQWGDSFAGNLSNVAKMIARVMMVVLGIVLLMAGRDWVNRLKSVGGGILIGIIVICYGTSLVSSMFA